MKRLFSVLVMMLVLVLASGGSLSGHDRSLFPGGSGGGAPTGDDHPWGGDQISTTGTSISVKYAGRVEVANVSATRTFLARAVCWVLLYGVEPQSTVQSTVDIRSTGGTASRPGASGSSTTNRQGVTR
jgi:hypothetical protein